MLKNVVQRRQMCWFLPLNFIFRVEIWRSHFHLDNFLLGGNAGLEFAHWIWRWWWGHVDDYQTIVVHGGKRWVKYPQAPLSRPTVKGASIRPDYWDVSEITMMMEFQKNLQHSIKLFCLHLKSCSWVQLPIFKAWTTFTTPAPYTWARKFRHHPGDLGECQKVDPSWPPFPLGWACPHGLRASPL